MSRWLALAGSVVLAGCGASSSGGGAEPVDSSLGVRDSSTGGEVGSAEVGTTSDAGRSDGGTSCDPARAWPVMLAAPIVPLQMAANLALDHDGTGLVARAYAESVNCALTTLADGGTSDVSWPPQLYGTWGGHDDVLVSIDPTTSDVTSLLMQGGYTGTLSFSSRAGGSNGSHAYVIGVGQIERDGTPMTIDWASQSPFDEVFDGLTATFAPALASVTACIASGECIWGFAQDAGTDAGQQAYYLEVTPLHLVILFDTVARGGLPTGLRITLPDGLPARSLDGGSED